MIATQRMARTAPAGVRSTAAVHFARWVGVLYTSAGIVGLGLTGLADPTTRRGAMLLVVEVNGLQNLIHLAVGVALVGASAASAEAARVGTMLSAAAFGVAGLLGLPLVGTDANVLALNQAANLLHLGTAVVAVACTVAAGRAATRRAPYGRAHHHR